MPTKQLIAVSTRLLTGASVLLVLGLGLGARLAWQQTAQSYGPDGTATAGEVALSRRLGLMMFDLSFRPVGVPLLLASTLVAAAVVALHRHPMPSRLGRLRWEVLGAWLLVLVPVVGLVLANVWVMTAPDDFTDMIGPQSMTELTVGSLTTLCASLPILALAGLWWMRLGASPDDPEDTVEQEDAARDPVPSEASGDASDGVDGESTMDYSRDWSPEDFRRPS